MEVCPFFNQVCAFTLLHKQPKGLPCLPNGLFCVCCPGSKSQKHVLRPESLEGTDEEDPVSALEWDLLSTDYLLGCDCVDAWLTST